MRGEETAVVLMKGEGGGEHKGEDDYSGEESPLMDLESASAAPPVSSSRNVRVRRRCLVEIFAVLPLRKEGALGVDQILLGNLVLATDRPGRLLYVVLCDISGDKPVRIDSQRYLVLTGPEYGVEIKYAFAMGPAYDPFFDNPLRGIWQAHDGCDTFMCGWMETVNGFMVVKFAVYSDGLEAHLEVTMSDLDLPEIPLEVYGTVTTSNSAVPHTEAKSHLFNHSRSDCCVIPDLASSAKVEIPLPLSRMVTVIPRESTLIVDLNLFLRCASGDMLIANDSVSFDAATRPRTIEEHTIKGSCAKLKVKVTWVEASDYDWKEEEKKGAVDNREVIAVAAATHEKCDIEDDQGIESDNTYDDDRSSQSLKHRRLNDSDDVYTRDVDYQTTEAMEIADEGQRGALPLVPSQVWRCKENFLEVFSVKFLDIENIELDKMYGLIMIHTGPPPHLLFRRVRGDPSKIDSQGFAILEGPRRCAWNVCSEVDIVPFLFKYQEFDFTGEHGCHNMWCHMDSTIMDKLLCKILHTDLGRIEVNFAVYRDSVEAHLSVMLTECSFSCAQVYGTITASNSMLQNPNAVSFVFKKEKCEADHVTIEPGNEISLPLMRPVVALPFDSIFYVNFDIFSEGKLIIHQQCEVQVPLDGEEKWSLPGNGCGVKVHVKFTTKQPDDIFFH